MLKYVPTNKFSFISRQLNHFQSLKIQYSSLVVPPASALSDIIMLLHSSETISIPEFKHNQLWNGITHQ